MRVALLCLLTACAVDPEPTVWMIDASANPHAHTALVDGASQWHELGFVGTAQDPGLPQCDVPADARTGSCQVSIAVFRVPQLIERQGISAYAVLPTREVWVDSSVTDYHAVLTIVAHEVGHILLYTRRHLYPGQRGVMQDTGGGWTVTPDDLVLACDVGVCP